MDSELALAPATEADSKLLLEWRNDPDVRSASRNTGEVSEEEHAAWFAGLLADPARHLLIAREADEPVGQIRFEPDAEGGYEVSVSVAGDRRGGGLGRALIEAGAAWLWEREPGARLVASVDRSNEASRVAFTAAGFAPAGDEDERFVRLTRSPG
jgi:RimJ/RimL family protein N-acetyltransferase